MDEKVTIGYFLSTINFDKIAKWLYASKNKGKTDSNFIQNLERGKKNSFDEWWYYEKQIFNLNTNENVHDTSKIIDCKIVQLKQYLAIYFCIILRKMHLN